MSEIRANTVTDAAGTGSPNFPNGLSVASAALTGVPTAPTATAATSTTQLATTAFVTTADNLKANLASPALTGTPTAPTAAVATNTTQIATTAFVLANVPAAGGMTLLGTLTTTSGTTQTLSGLTLTSYKILYVFFNAVGQSSGSAATLIMTGPFNFSPNNTGNVSGNAVFDLVSGRYIATTVTTTLGATTATSNYGNPSITTASTSIAFTWSTGATFNAGSILIYGVK
jgi:hypothetical protein